MAVVRVLPAAAEAALGGPVPDGLEAHLAALSGCPRPQGIQLTSLLQALPPAILRAVGACGSSSGGEADTGDRLPPLVAAAVYELCDALEHFHWQAKEVALGALAALLATGSAGDPTGDALAVCIAEAGALPRLLEMLSLRQSANFVPMRQAASKVVCLLASRPSPAVRRALARWRPLPGLVCALDVVLTDTPQVAERLLLAFADLFPACHDQLRDVLHPPPPAPVQQPRPQPAVGRKPRAARQQQRRVRLEDATGQQQEQQDAARLASSTSTSRSSYMGMAPDSDAPLQQLLPRTLGYYMRLAPAPPPGLGASHQHGRALEQEQEHQRAMLGCCTAALLAASRLPQHLLTEMSYSVRWGLGSLMAALQGAAGGSGPWPPDQVLRCATALLARLGSPTTAVATDRLWGAAAAAGAAPLVPATLQDPPLSTSLVGGICAQVAVPLLAWAAGAKPQAGAAGEAQESISSASAPAAGAKLCPTQHVAAMLLQVQSPEVARCILQETGSLMRILLTLAQRIMHEAGALTVAMPPSSCTTLQPPSPTRRDQALHLGQWALAIAHLMCVSGPAGAVNEAAGPPADPAAADVPPPPGKPSKRRRLQEQQQHPLLCQGSAAGGSSQASEAQPHALLLCGLLPLLVPAFKLALRSVGGQAGQPELVAALGLLIPHLTATQASTLVQGGVGLVVSELMEQLMTATPSASGAEGQQPQLGKAAGAAAAPAAIAQPGGVADVCAWEGRAHGFPWWNPTALDCLVILLQLTRLSGGGAGEGAWCSSLTHAHVLSGIGALLHTHSPPHDSPAAGLSAPSAQGTPGAVCHNAGAPPAAEAAATGPPAYRSQGVQGKAEYAARLAWGLVSSATSVPASDGARRGVVVRLVLSVAAAAAPSTALVAGLLPVLQVMAGWVVDTPLLQRRGIIHDVLTLWAPELQQLLRARHAPPTPAAEGSRNDGPGPGTRHLHLPLLQLGGKGKGRKRQPSCSNTASGDGQEATTVSYVPAPAAQAGPRKCGPSRLGGGSREASSTAAARAGAAAQPAEAHAQAPPQVLCRSQAADGAAHAPPAASGAPVHASCSSMAGLGGARGVALLLQSVLERLGGRDLELLCSLQAQGWLEALGQGSAGPDAATATACTEALQHAARHAGAPLLMLHHRARDQGQGSILPLPPQLLQLSADAPGSGMAAASLGSHGDMPPPPKRRRIRPGAAADVATVPEVAQVNNFASDKRAPAPADGAAVRRRPAAAGGRTVPAASCHAPLPTAAPKRKKAGAPAAVQAPAGEAEGPRRDAGPSCRAGGAAATTATVCLPGAAASAASSSLVPPPAASWLQRLGGLELTAAEQHLCRSTAAALQSLQATLLVAAATATHGDGRGGHSMAAPSDGGKHLAAGSSKLDLLGNREAVEASHHDRHEQQQQVADVDDATFLQHTYRGVSKRLCFASDSEDE